MTAAAPSSDRTGPLDRLVGGPERTGPHPDRPDAPLPFLVAAGMLTGFSAVVYNINQVSFRQAITPAPMQGRMNATMRFIVWGTIPIGQVVGGVVATAASIPTALWIGAIGSFLAVVPLVVTPVRSLRDMPTPAEGDAPTGVEVAD